MNEDLIHLLKILEIVLIASIKFLIAPFEAERYGFDFKNAFLITTAGGIIGIIVFSLVGEVIAFGWGEFIRFFKTPLQKEVHPKQKFTWTRKFVINTKIKFGLIGLIITTPSIISIPIGTFVIHRFYRRQWRNILFLCISHIVWSFLLNGIAQYLKLSQYLPK